MLGRTPENPGFLAPGFFRVPIVEPRSPGASTNPRENPGEPRK